MTPTSNHHLYTNITLFFILGLNSPSGVNDSSFLSIYGSHKSTNDFKTYKCIANCPNTDIVRVQWKIEAGDRSFYNFLRG